MKIRVILRIIVWDCFWRCSFMQQKLKLQNPSKQRVKILEIMHVTRDEARIYPTVTVEAKPSEYIPMLQSDPALRPVAFTEIRTDFEFLVNPNSFLRVMRG